MGTFIEQRASATGPADGEIPGLDEARARMRESRSDVIELVVRVPDGAIVRATEGAAQAYAVPRAELLRRALADLVVTGPTLELVALARLAAASGGFRFEAEHRRADGRTFPVEAAAGAFELGGVTYVELLERDLSDQRRREQERAAAAAVFARDAARELADSAPIFIWRSGQDGRRVWSNRRWLEFTGRTQAQEEGDGWAECLHPDDRAGALAARDQAVAALRSFAMEYRLRRADGTYRWVLDAVTPHFDRKAFTGFVGYALDLTDRLESEASLRRLGAAVEQAPVSIVITDAGGVIEYVNPAFERNTGYSPAEAIGGRPSLTKSGVHPPEFYAQLWATITAGNVWSGRIVNRAKDGRLVTENVVIAPVRDVRGAIRSYVAVKRDVTVELALEEQLAASRRLDSIAALAGGIAHDFNNLLTVILSCGEDLRETIAAGGVVEPAPIDAIQAAAERARDLTRKLLAFARRQVIEPVPLDLNERTRDGLHLLSRILREDIAIVTRLQEGLWTVRFDPAQFEQVVLNLAVNSGDAMPAGGTFTVETSNFEVGEGDDGGFPGLRPGAYVRLAVRDTGAGMSAEVRARAFEPFYTTKPGGKGTGLGLATVHGIVKQSGGFIRVESEPGRGTSVEMLFPRCEEPPASFARARAPALTRGTETVLLAEDDPMVRDVAVAALRQGGYEVLVSENGAAALQLLEREGNRVQLLVTDVVMPGMDGVQLADALRARWPGIAVLFVSGHAHEVLAARGVEPGHVSMLAKPFTATSLLVRVREVLDAGPRAIAP
jgi:PAS domain S-box-containing protein